MSVAPTHIVDINGYIFFSPKTIGYAGKPIKIHASLLIDFLLSVDPKTADGQAIIRDIESLRSFANTDIGGIVRPKDIEGGPAHKKRLENIHATLNSMVQNTNIKRERPFITKNVRVYYYIDQRPGDAYRTVYINEIQVRAKDVADAGGIYETFVKKFGTSVEKSGQTDLEGRSVYVSGAEKTPADAMQRAKEATQLKTPILFFVPEQAAETLTVYRGNRPAKDLQQLTNELTNIIQKNATNRVTWTVEAEGASLLDRALKQVTGSLKTHTFNFINAQGNLPRLVQSLKDKSVDLTGQFMRMDYTRKKSLTGAVVSTAKYKNALASQLLELSGSQSKVPTQQVGDVITGLGMAHELGRAMNNTKINQILKLPQALRGSKMTFVDVLTRVRG